MERLRRSSHTYLFAVLVIVILGLCLVNPTVDGFAALSSWRLS